LKHHLKTVKLAAGVSRHQQQSMKAYIDSNILIDLEQNRISKQLENFGNRSYFFSSIPCSFILKHMKCQVQEQKGRKD
jgi:threonyl-tRNA synthetase